MKYNFIVSDYRKLWIEGSGRLFILEPFVYSQLQKDGRASDYQELIVAPSRRRSGADLQKDHDFVQLKFEKYVDILAERLNRIHGTSYSRLFWERALSLSFERYITLAHEIFANCEAYFNADEHDCRVLSRTSYFVPPDFDAQRVFFQHSHYGQEQLFSIYMHIFHPEGLKTADERFEPARRADSPVRPGIFRALDQFFSPGALDKVKREVFKKYYSRRTHKIGVLGSFFSAKNMNLLMTRSGGAIYPLERPPAQAGPGEASPARADRERLAETRRDFDRFDLFFFASLESCFPAILVEDFRNAVSLYSEYLLKYKELEYVTSEAWLSSSRVALALALLRERGVRHIFNEHNYFEHPWAGSLIRREAGLSDIFMSLGWEGRTIPNLVKGASLREFELGGRPAKRYKICYVSSIPLAKRPHYTAAYGENAENAPKYIKFVRSFFEKLSKETRGEILFRGYPGASSAGWLYYDLKVALAPYLEQVKRFDDTSPSSRSLMLRSNLVIVDYIATSWLESVLMNIPTVFFWNKEAYYLNGDYPGFFEPLISAGICQTDPAKAAQFVETIKDDPEKWWRQEAVQKAKDAFLRKNIGKPEVMIDLLLGLLKPEEGPPAGKVKQRIA